MIQIIGVTEECKIENNIFVKDTDFSQYKWFWVDFAEPTDEEIKHLSTTFDFHPLAIEDCIQSLQRPKLDYYANHTFYVAHSVRKKKKKFIKMRSISF
ncbi:magnesium and cobalt transport protein CorA [Gracilibacillus boraciitolerans JCM 21714]|uniref:Magnesium and cobalt transport protein CorA n=1 Tax=Gracilibacillus boraciitolerans JCM 21714 TaxID=1298598 RepID=W4VME6_9BACI|nr:magnesium and cobalt transport protein CorA [Gracilibacillus boraciitolerans JCM 21714]